MSPLDFLTQVAGGLFILLLCALFGSAIVVALVEMSRYLAGVSL